MLAFFWAVNTSNVLPNFAEVLTCALQDPYQYSFGTSIVSAPSLFAVLVKLS